MGILNILRIIIFYRKSLTVVVEKIENFGHETHGNKLMKFSNYFGEDVVGKSLTGLARAS